jgi:hypothetical protein
MSPEKQRILIAAICGYKQQGDSCWWDDPSESEQLYIHDLPDYLNDLNATHEMEKSLGDVDNWLKYEGFLDEGGTKFLFHATAAQRVEAFLRVFGLWEEDK